MKRRSGFTLIEMVIAITLGVILMSIAFSAVGNARQSASLDQSRRMLQAMYARARASAIEAGSIVYFRLDGPSDYAEVVRNDSILESFDFEQELDVDLFVNGSPVEMCLTANGTADYDCNSFASMNYGRMENRNGQTWEFWLMPAGGFLEQN